MPTNRCLSNISLFSPLIHLPLVYIEIMNLPGLPFKFRLPSRRFTRPVFYRSFIMFNPALSRSKLFIRLIPRLTSSSDSFKNIRSVFPQFRKIRVHLLLNSKTGSVFFFRLMSSNDFFQRTDFSLQ